MYCDCSATFQVVTFSFQVLRNELTCDNKKWRVPLQPLGHSHPVMCVISTVRQAESATVHGQWSPWSYHFWQKLISLQRQVTQLSRISTDTQTGLPACSWQGHWQSPASRVCVGAGIAQLVVLGLAVDSVACSILLWGLFPVEGIFPSELTWVQTPFPKKLLRMRV